VLLDGQIEWDEKEGYLSRIVDRLKREGVQADQWLLEGEVLSALEEWVGEMDADLIVMATHGRGGLQRLRLGSVAESLVSRGLAPMLLLHPGAEGGSSLPPSVEKVVVALDRSHFAQAIVDPLLTIGPALGVQSYTLVHVVDDRGVGRAGWEPVSAIQLRAEEHLEGVRARLQASDAQVEVRVVVASEPSEGILGVVREIGAGLIAMTTHGMSGLRPTLLGSVAANVLHSWEGPLLLHRPREEQTA
jgi:nucleotide-binding universal stress UspA family protein